MRTLLIPLTWLPSLAVPPTRRCPEWSQSCQLTMPQPRAAASVLPPLLLLLLSVPTPPLAGARPSPGPEYLRRGWLRLLAEGEGCAPCRPEECAAPRGCLAGRVRDACGCCWECANLEGQLCDLDPSAHFYGRCGEQLECRLDTGGDLSRGEVPEPLCACRSQRPLCGSDGRTYAQICRLQEAARARPDANLTVAHPGPCESGTHIPGGLFCLLSGVFGGCIPPRRHR